MRILALIADWPDPPITGSRVRNFHLWPVLARLGVELKVLGLDRDRDAVRPVALAGVDAEFFKIPRDPIAVRRAWNVLTRSYHQWPRSAALANRVDELVAAWHPDVVHAEELSMAHYLPGMRGRTIIARQSITMHNVESDLYERIGNPPVPFGRGLVKRLHLRSLRRYEARAAARADLAFAYSAFDLQRYAQLYPRARWSHTRNGADVRGISPAPQPAEPTVLLVASWSYGPNRTGLAWFFEAIAPGIMPGTAITVAGSGADAALRQELAERGVRFVDTPRDLAPLYNEHAVVAVPLLEGSGTRGKILEALAHERLVVTTTKGAEGLDLRDGEGVVIADEPAAFADRINQALTAPANRSEVARRGRAAVLARYDWSIVATELKDAWEACVTKC
jgi:glycosyltransferase involved in cell wall biosynthesis